MLQRPKYELNPTAPAPPADQLRSAPLGLHTQQIEAVLARLIDNDHGDLAIRWAGRCQSGIAHLRLPGALTPRPIGLMDQVVSFDLTTIGQDKDIGLFTLYEHRALMHIAHMVHELRVTKPTIRHHHGPGNAKPRRPNAARRSSNIRRAHVSLS